MLNDYVEITCYVNTSDGRLFKSVIDGLVRSKVFEDNGRLYLNFHISELKKLTKKLDDLENETAMLWAEDIRALPEYKEINK